MSRTIVRNVGQLVTVSGPGRARIGLEQSELNIQKNCEILIENGIFTEIGESLNRLSGDVEVDVQGRVILPGLVDAHTHFVFANNRVREFDLRIQGATYQEIAEGGGGIRSSMRAVREATVDQLGAEASDHLWQMVAHGTTTAEVKTGYGLNLENELKMLEAAEAASEVTGAQIIKTFLGPHVVPPEFVSVDEYLSYVCEVMLPAVRPRVSFADMFVEDRYFTPEHCRRYAIATGAADLPLRLHVDQLRDGSGAVLAAELGVASADHLEHCSPEGIQAMVAAKISPVLLPASVYCLGLDRYAPARSMIEAGLAVVVATDFNPGSSPTPSLPFCMSLACLRMKMTPAEALVSTTINAAYSLGIGHTSGSVEVGKRADFVVLKGNDWREVAYWAGTNPVAESWIGGTRITVR